MLRQAEHLAFDRHGPQLAGTCVDVAEDVTVKRLQGCQVIAARQSPAFQVDQPGGGQGGLDVRQLNGVVDIQPVQQYTALRIDVRVRAGSTPHVR